MDILSIINAATNKANNRSLDSDKHMIALNSREYDFIYRELKYKNSFHFTDTGDKMNFMVRIPHVKDIQTIMKNKKIVSIARGVQGPEVVLNIEGFEKGFVFNFDLNNELHLYDLKRIMITREIYMHFLLWTDNQLIQCFTALLGVDERIVERLIHMLELTYTGEYPRINSQGFQTGSYDYFIFDGEENVLEDLLDLTDILQKWGSKDVFNIYVDYNNGYKIIINGDAQNKMYIKNELSKKYKLLEEGSCLPSGIAFFKYDKGMLYFYKTSFSY